MSDEPEDTCTARTLHAGYEVTCDRELDHPSVHLGKSLADDGGTELHQWPDAQSIGDDEPGDEIPLWYAVLPLGERVQVDLREPPTLDRFEGELTGAVLDDHEQPAALLLERQQDAGTDLRVLIPWANVAAIAWEVERDA